MLRRVIPREGVESHNALENFDRFAVVIPREGVERNRRAFPIAFSALMCDPERGS